MELLVALFAVLFVALFCGIVCSIACGIVCGIALSRVSGRVWEGADMDFKELEYVVALAKYGSITKAAQALFISQPTLSIFLSRLEERIGITLFNRIGKKLALTYAGELYVKRAREILIIQNQFQSELSGLVNQDVGRIRFGIHSRRSSHLLPRVIFEFSKKHPHIELVLTEASNSKMESMLLNGELDLILTNLLTHEDKLTLIPVYRNYFLMVISPKNLICREAVTAPGQAYPFMDLKLAEQECFILQAPHQSTRSFTNLAIEYAGVVPKSTFVIENMETASQMAAEDCGVAFNMESYARYFTYEKPVALFRVGDPAFSVNICLAYRKGGYLPSYTADFMGCVMAVLNGGTHESSSSTQK